MNQNPSSRLLAKSYPQAKFPEAPPDFALLTQHSRDVAEACGALAQVVGELILRQSGLESVSLQEFEKTLKATGWFEDIGKGSSHFQEMVTNAPQITQLIRHETISGLLLWQNQKIRNWLAPLGKTLLPAIWGAMGHHRKFDALTKPDVRVPSLKVFLSHPDFSEILGDISRDLDLPLPPVFEKDLVIAADTKEPCDVAARNALQNLKEDFRELAEEYAGPEARRLLALTKALGVAADVAASAVAARGKSAARYSLKEFVRLTLSVGLTPDDFDRLIREWAWNQKPEAERPADAEGLPPTFMFREFQLAVAASDSGLTLARAGCGSGKSLAAYLWGKEWCARALKEGRTNFRLFFCLPTTGTTTEHFKDYALESGIPASLSHSRSGVDLKSIAGTAFQEDASEGERDTAKAANAALNDERDKIESLALWDTPLVVTTADTVLGLMANARRSIYSFPAMMSGGIVFDEIHSFDDRMFGHLLIFLKNFPRLPVLLMTASLPEERLAALLQVRPDLNSIPGPPEFEDLERYVLHKPDSRDDVWEKVAECIEARGKVLWVCNRVDWANEAYADFASRFPKVAVNVYHSRFRYKDRSRLHRHVIDKFKQPGIPAILISTQVAEMSLDLSADLLVTDIAPIPSLIQRLGRLNRKSTPANPQVPKPAFICPLPPATEKNKKPEAPYQMEDLEKAGAWILELIQFGGALRQRDLAEVFARFSEPKEFDLETAEEAACFFSGVWETRPGMTRGEGYTVNVILQADLENCRDLRNGEPTRDWLLENEVSVLFREEVLKWPRVGHRYVAPSDRITYDFSRLESDEGEKMKGVGAQWANTQPTSCLIL